MEAGEMKLKDSIVQAFGEERAALCEAEIQQLAESNYSERDLVDFLETYAGPAGVFYVLSMLRRAKLGIKDLREAVNFLFNPTPTILKTIHASLPLDSRILDFGCGRGQITCALALRGFETYGVDVSRDALKIARKLAFKLNCKVTFHLVRKNKIQFPNEYFDAVLSFWVFHEVQRNRLPHIVEELHRTVRRDGFVFIIDQEGVAKFENIKGLMKQHGFEFHSEKFLSPVYDHGKASRALMLIFVRK
jgi:2-polyprenyl-3-methyl-5-hydroxy-6-metoxy-1,4-benzoquinol methylase